MVISVYFRFGFESQLVDMEKKEGDGEGGSDRRQRAQEAPLRLGPSRPIHSLQRLSLAQVWSLRRPRWVPETRPGLPLHEGSFFSMLLFGCQVFFSSLNSDSYYRSIELLGLFVLLERNFLVHVLLGYWENLKFWGNGEMGKFGFLKKSSSPLCFPRK